MEQSLEERVRSIVVDQLGVSPDMVTATAKFGDDLGADSLDAIELMMALEEEFQVAIMDEEAASLTDLVHVIDFLHQNGIEG